MFFSISIYLYIYYVEEFCVKNKKKTKNKFSTWENKDKENKFILFIRNLFSDILSFSHYIRIVYSILYTYSI
jgi:uncharacterized membrane protein